jgi:hypothetical protein
MRVREIRFLTALAVIGLCLFAIARGWEIGRFRIAEAGLRTDGNQRELLGYWAGISGVASSALEASLPGAIDPNDREAAQRQLGQLTEILSLRPLSSTHWLSLSGTRLVIGQPTNKIIGALILSSMTGPNEGQIMLQRGAFELSLWELLPPELQKRTSVDIGETLRLFTQLQAADRNNLKTVAATRTADVRQTVRNLLVEEQGISPEVLKDAGF